jgi:hypothetical protein
MSVYQVRPGTQRSVDELLRVATENTGVEVVIFNKTGCQLTGRDLTENINVIELLPETFGQTIGRLKIDDNDHIVWCNDDDYFNFQNDLLGSVTALGTDCLGLPEMAIVTSSHTYPIVWDSLIHASSISSRYEAYAITAAPLIFAVIPGPIFNIWTNYVRQSFIKFPYLDTQLNLACLMANVLSKSPTHRYRYEANNWESAEKMHQTTERWIKELKLNKNAVFTLDLCRSIEDVVFVYTHPTCSPEMKKEFIEILLDQFKFMSTIQKSFFIKTLRGRIFVRLFTHLPLGLQRPVRKLYQFYYTCSEPKYKELRKFQSSLPRQVLDVFLGLADISTIIDFQNMLNIEELSHYLCIPVEQVEHWKLMVSES